MELTRDNVIWFAGLLEGEGCLSNFPAKGRKATKWSMMVKMTDHDVVQKIHMLFGGNLYFKKLENPKHKDQYHWQTGNRKVIYALCAAMTPFMGERRKAKMIAFIKDFASRPANSSEQTKKLWADPVWRENQLADRIARRGINVKGLTKADYR